MADDLDVSPANEMMAAEDARIMTRPAKRERPGSSATEGR